MSGGGLFLYHWGGCGYPHGYSLQFLPSTFTLVTKTFRWRPYKRMLFFPVNYFIRLFLIKINHGHYLCLLGRPNRVVVRGAGCYIKGPGFESRVRHGYQTVRPRPHQWLSGSALNILRRKVQGSILGRVCRPSRSEFSVFFCETRLSTGWDPLEETPTEGTPPIGLSPS